MQSHTISPEADAHGRESQLFVREALRDLRNTGAIAPSSRRLAGALAEPVRAQGRRPLSVLEAGAGTGPVTRVLLPLIGPGSRLDIVESNPRFTAHLRQQVRGYPTLGGQVRVHCSGVERFDVGHRYDVIVSGLPFTNFAPDEVEAIMNRYLELLHPGGALTYFAYRGTRFARRALASRAEAARHRAVEAVLAEYRRRYGNSRVTVWGNLPPADVWQLRAPDSALSVPSTKAAVSLHTSGENRRYTT